VIPFLPYSIHLNDSPLKIPKTRFGASGISSCLAPRVTTPAEKLNVASRHGHMPMGKFSLEFAHASGSFFALSSAAAGFRTAGELAACSVPSERTVI
jgi:hypothetical protein